MFESSVYGVICQLGLVMSYNIGQDRTIYTSKNSKKKHQIKCMKASLDDMGDTWAFVLLNDLAFQF